MPLPTIVAPTHELTLPSNEKVIKFRPFLVKEEKLLLLALESQDQKEIKTAITTILKNCILTKGIKLEALPQYDIEFIFLNIRAKSVGEEVELTVICPDDEETEVQIKIDLTTVKVKKNPDHTNKIKLNDDMILEFKYPSLESFVEQNFNIENLSYEQSFDLMIDNIDKLYNKDEVFTFNDYTPDDWKEFLEQLPSLPYIGIRTFFETMPKLSHDIEIENPKTGVKSSYTIEGLASFFPS